MRNAEDRLAPPGAVFPASSQADHSILRAQAAGAGLRGPALGAGLPRPGCTGQNRVCLPARRATAQLRRASRAPAGLRGGLRARASGCGIESAVPGGAADQEERAECLRPNGGCRRRDSGDGSRAAAGHRRHTRLPDTTVYPDPGGMKKSLGASTLLSFMLGAVAASAVAQTNVAVPPVQLPVKEKLHLYLLMGQSNMAGRGQIGAEDKTLHPRVVLFTLQSNWEPEIEPVTHDKPGMLGRSEERRVGKECRSRWSPY